MDSFEFSKKPYSSLLKRPLVRNTDSCLSCSLDGGTGCSGNQLVLCTQGKMYNNLIAL